MITTNSPFGSNINTMNGFFTQQKLSGSRVPTWAEPVLKAVEKALNDAIKKINPNPNANMVVGCEWIGQDDCQADMGMVAVTIRRNGLLGVTLTGFTADWAPPAIETVRRNNTEYNVYPIPSRTFTDGMMENVRRHLTQKHFTPDEIAACPQNQALVTILTKQVIQNDLVPVAQVDRIADLIVTTYSAHALLRTSSATDLFAPNMEFVRSGNGLWTTEVAVGHFDGELHGAFIAADMVLSVFFNPAKGGQQNTRLLAGKVYIKATAKYAPDYASQGADSGRTWQPVLVITGIECMANQSIAWKLFLVSFLNQLGGAREIWKAGFLYSVAPTLRSFRHPVGYMVEAPMDAGELAEIRNVNMQSFSRTTPVEFNGEYLAYWTRLLAVAFHRNPTIAVCANRASGDAHWSHGFVGGRSGQATRAVSEMFRAELAVELGLPTTARPSEVEVVLQGRYPVVNDNPSDIKQVTMTGLSVLADGKTQASTMRLMDYLTIASLCFAHNPESVLTYGALDNNPNVPEVIDQRLKMVKALLPEVNIGVHDFAEIKELNTGFLNLLFTSLGLNVAPVDSPIGADGWQNSGMMGRGVGLGRHTSEIPMVQTQRTDGYGGQRGGQNPYAGGGW